VVVGLLDGSDATIETLKAIEHPNLEAGSDSRRGLFVRGYRERAMSTGDVTSL
jgi:hypothetical protein